ncbi:MAG: DUF853 domain-containing protein [Lachnospiraceae bacterium]|nr:DUF853 domain-containing protein [Lachnospiraceae bacterium]
MYKDGKIWIGQAGEEDICIYPKMANRHGMIAGATGTGKTVTLKVMAESFSDAGVPVFLADVKGDLSGMCRPGENSGTVAKRIEALDLMNKGFSLHAYPTTFWDVYGEKGINMRTTISEMGPILLGRILGLNETQADILTIVFKIADDEGLLLLDTKDLKSMINYIAANTGEYAAAYGNMTEASLNVIIRAIVALESEGGEEFFMEPAIRVSDLSTVEYDGRGRINILDCQKLINNPNMYSTFMLWMLSELYEDMPEAGDLNKPKMVFFFDEAHMLFDSASKTLLTKIEQIVKLIRSKGIGVYFITQNPQDIPDGVLGQLSNKIQHALRAYTPKELKGAKIAAESFRANPDFDTFEVLTQLGVGEALVSVLDDHGIPTVVQKVSILPPQSFNGIIDDATREEMIRNNPLFSKFNESYDRESAYEMLTNAVTAGMANAEAKAEAEAANVEAADAEISEDKKRIAELEAELARKNADKESLIKKPNPSHTGKSSKEDKESKKTAKKDDATSKAYKRAAKSVASTATGTIGREIGNSLGSNFGKFGKKLGGNVGASIGRNIMGILFR